MEYVTTNGEQEHGEIRRPKAERKDTMSFYHEKFVLDIEGLDEIYRYAQELGGNIETLRENLWVTEEQILSCFEKNRDQLSGYYYDTILRKLPKTEEYGKRILSMFLKTQNNSVKISLAECLTDFATEETYLTFYDLMKDSPIHKVPMEACRIAHTFRRPDLLALFATDHDDHIRAFVHRTLRRE